MVTGTAVYQELFQGLLAERANANGEDTLVPVVKLSGDSNAFVYQINEMIPYAYDFIDLSYSGSNLTTAVFKSGGSGGTIVATLTITYDVNNNIKTVTRT